MTAKYTALIHAACDEKSHDDHDNSDIKAGAVQSPRITLRLVTHDLDVQKWCGASEATGGCSDRDDQPMKKVRQYDIRTGSNTMLI